MLLSLLVLLPLHGMSSRTGRCNTSSEEETSSPQSKACRKATSLGSNRQAFACDRPCQPKAKSRPEAKASRCAAKGLEAQHGPQTLGVKSPRSPDLSAGFKRCAHEARCDTSTDEEPCPQLRATATAASCPKGMQATPPAAEAKSKSQPNAAVRTTDSLPTMPKSSGVLDYMAWAFDHVLSLRHTCAIAMASPLAVGCMDAGIAEIALHAIKQKLCPFVFQIRFRAEQDRAKLSCLNTPAACRTQGQRWANRTATCSGPATLWH